MVDKKIFEEEDDIIAFEFVTIKALGKSSTGALISNAVAIGSHCTLAVVLVTLSTVSAGA